WLAEASDAAHTSLGAISGHRSLPIKTVNPTGMTQWRRTRAKHLLKHSKPCGCMRPPREDLFKIENRKELLICPLRSSASPSPLFVCSRRFRQFARSGARRLLPRLHVAGTTPNPAATRDRLRQQIDRKKRIERRVQNSHSQPIKPMREPTSILPYAAPSP